jgi:1,4-alpha-glucan branching enzyme
MTAMDILTGLAEAPARGLSRPSRHAGMGAVLYNGGVAFRVWAPNARSVAVAGDFNEWSGERHPLMPEGGGTWSADIEGARAGDGYKFVILGPAGEVWRKNPYARDVDHSNGHSIVVDPAFDWSGDEAFRAPPWHELVIYEMHIGTFNDTPGGSPGDLRTAIRRLPHLVELGVSAIQIMPIGEFPGDHSWGYNPADIFAIESAYGGPHGLKAFIKAAHAHGLAVIVDVVYNHLGPSDLDLWQFDGWQEDGKGGIYFYNDWRSQTPWGDTRPDYGRGEVRQLLRDNALFWLDEFRADGLRFDMTLYIRTVSGNPHDPGQVVADGWRLMQWINGEIDEHFPWKITIAEDLQDDPWLTKDEGAGGASFDSQWAANFVHPVRAALITGDDGARSMGTVREAILGRYNEDGLQRVIYTESHDEVANGRARVPHEIWPGNAGSWAARKRSTLGAVLTFTSPGIPMLFQGQELLEDEWFRDTDPIDWSKKERFAGIFRLYRDLIRLRRNGWNDSRGLRGQHVNVFHVNDDAKVIAFHRFDEGGPGDDVVVVLNFANRAFDAYTVGFPRGGLWRVRFNSDSRHYGEDYGDHPGYDAAAHAETRDGLPFSGDVGLAPYSALILTQDG